MNRSTYKTLNSCLTKSTTFNPDKLFQGDHFFLPLQAFSIILCISKRLASANVLKR